jgi:hypothetical protein
MIYLINRQLLPAIKWLIFLLFSSLSLIAALVLLGKIPLSFSSSSTLLAEIPFKHIIIDENPNSGADCCTDVAALGDMNGDGYLDLVIGAEDAETNGLVWYEYPHWSRHPIGDGDFTTDGETGDVDGDGDTDVIISSISRDVIEWWENTDDPTQKEHWVGHEIAAGFAHDVAVGDIDDDGKLDVVVKRKDDGSLIWFEPPDDPTLPWSEHQIDSFSGEGLDLGDVDGDGDLDIAVSHYWYENQNSNGSQWQQWNVSLSWGDDARTIISDMNDDGLADIILSHSEGKGRVSWFENPAWSEHLIESDELEGAHSLEVGDFDGDGDPDLFTGEMHTSWSKQVLIYENLGGAASWNKITLANSGSHNARIADIGNDGDLDIVGKNYGGEGRVIEMWENFSANTHELEKWQYIPLDTSRPESQMGKMGLVFADINSDEQVDIIAGAYLYRNPGADMRALWTRTELPHNIDVYFAVDVDDDQYHDLVGISDSTLEWIEAADEQGTAWNAYPIGSVPGGRTQGYTLAQLVPGGKPELVFTRAKNLYYLEIPAENPEGGAWPMVQVSSTNEEEGVAAGDLDQDGDIDIAAIDADGHHAIWFENPADGSENWPKHVIGRSSQWLDRIALVDINDDSRLDIILTEETQDREYNASIYWFEAPLDPKQGEWVRHTVDTQRSVNSMDVADMDGDGDIDIVAAEHTDNGGRWEGAGEPDNLTLWYENQNNGTGWLPHTIEIGNHSSHLGARVHDLDNDGDLDVLSIAWRQYNQLHLWRNLTQ